MNKLRRIVVEERKTPDSLAEDAGNDALILRVLRMGGRRRCASANDQMEMSRTSMPRWYFHLITSRSEPSMSSMTIQSMSLST